MTVRVIFRKASAAELPTKFIRLQGIQEKMERDLFEAMPRLHIYARLDIANLTIEGR